MKNLYFPLLLVCLLLSYGRLSAQCSVTISTDPGTTQLSCAVKNIILTANTSAQETVKYVWSTGGSGKSITVSDSAVYSVTITDDTGCVSTSSVRITRIDDAPAVTAYAFPNKICSGDTVLLASLGTAATYSWEPGSLPGGAVKVVPSATTTYTVTATASNGCTGTGTVQVTVNPLPTASVTGTATVCQNASQPLVTFRALGGTPPYTFAYTLNDGFVQKIYVNGMGDVASIPAPTGVLGTFTYKLVSIDGNGCTQAQNGTATVTVLPGPSLTSPKSASVCNNTLFVYNAESSAGGTSFSWTRPAVAGISNSAGGASIATISEMLQNTTPAPIVVPYIFTLSTGTGCVVTDTLKVTVNPTPVIDSVDNKRFCNGTSVNNGIPFTSTPSGSGVFFSWTNSNPGIGLPTRGNGDIPPFTTANNTNNPETATITATAYLLAGTATCTGASTSFTIMVLPAPVLISSKAVSVCSNALFNYTATSSAAVTTLFSWTRPVVTGISNPANGASIATISETLQNTTPAPIVVSYIFTLSTGDGCGLTTDTLKVTVNPTPRINRVNDTTFCNGVFVSNGIAFSSTSPDSSFSWTNSNPGIGLPARGNGNILPFNAVNITNNPVTATITVSIKVGTAACAGADTAFIITVLPAPVLTSGKITSVCNNAPFNYTATSSAAVTTLFSWTRPAVTGISNPANGVLSATISETLHNTTSVPIVVSYIFTLSTGTGCGITTDTLKVTVNPTVVINQVNDTTFCNGTSVSGGILFTSLSPNVSFSWTNSNTSIGLQASGNDGIRAFTATNNTNSPVVATIVVTAYLTADAATCTAADKDTFTITVRPAPVLTSIKAASICNNDLLDYTIKSAEGTNFSWTRSAVAGISNLEGRGSTATIHETLRDTTPLPVVVTYSIRLSPPGAGGCETRDTLKVTVNPTPVINQARDTVFCNGFSASRGILFASLSPGVSFKWKGNNPNIGLPDSGTGNILPFIARNTTNTLLKDTITVSIKVGADSCAGRDTTFIITVRPAPLLISIKDTSICNNTPFIYTARTATGTNFSWTRTQVNNIMPATGNGSSGTVNETLYNSGIFKAVVPYIFTLPGNEIFCETKDTLKVTVTPTPVIDTIRDTTICNGDLVNVPFTSKSPEVTFRWTNSNPNIGLVPTNGKGIIFPFKAINNTNNPDTATITVAVDSIAGVANCAGAIVRTFKIIVRPGPVLISKKDTSVCNNVQFLYAARSSAAGTSFSWRRAQVTGITPATNNGSTATVRETLANSSSQPLLVKYYFELSTGIGCSITRDSVLVTINPTVSINSIDPKIFCKDSLVQPINFSSNVNNALLNWNWKSDKQIGLGLEGNGNFIPAFVTRISDTATVPVSAKVTVTASVGNGCSPDTKDFQITVYPRPVLTSPKTASVCNNTPFNYTAKSSAAQTNFSWVRYADKDNPERHGSTDAISNDILRNNGLQPVTVKYYFTLSVTGSVCQPVDSVMVTVNPTPVMDTINPRTYCNGIPASGIGFRSTYPDSSFNWSSDISVGFGLGNNGSIPAFTATNTGTAPVTAHVKVSVKAYGGCPGSPDEKTFTITVNPSPQRPAFTSLFNNPDNVTLYVCNGSENINFNVNSYNPAVNYTWSATPGSPGVNIKNTGDSNTVISFSSPGNDTIILTARLPSLGGCTNTASQVVHVSNQVIEIFKPSPIILMQPGNLLVYKQNSLAGYQYQWGYDSVISNASRSFVRPVPVQGQVYQYFIPGTKFITAGTLNTVDYNYWVSLTLLKNDTLCPTRAYYNGAYRSRIITDPPAEDSTFRLQIFPNPNRGVFEIALKGKIYGSILAQIQNAKGQVVFTKRIVKTALSTTEKLDAGNLPAGLYFLILYNQHHTPITSRFVIQR